MNATNGYHVYRKNKPEPWEQKALATEAFQDAVGVFYQAEHTDVGVPWDAKKNDPAVAQFVEHIEQTWERVR